ncbi:RNA-directed DNA polymerase (Reverse transcriptase), partial [Trifolium medium]|nr:RNA-directed DNA polymerase (Reverse transcriptase) [Trifolium medium]
MYEPEAVLAARKIQQKGEEIKQYLIKWKGKTAEETTWEEAIMMKSQFPKFSLEDKALVEEESIDR